MNCCSKRRGVISVSAVVVLFLLIFLIAGCGDDSSYATSDNTPITFTNAANLHEHDFAVTPTLAATPQQVIILNLEHPTTTDVYEHDSAIVGIDEVPLYFAESTLHTFTLEHSGEQNHEMIVLDPDHNEILHLTPDYPSQELMVEAGLYILEIHHGGGVPEGYTVFIRPGSTYVGGDCPNCDLSGADLTGADLTDWKTPGVYIDEVNGFPNSVVPIATAVPAFIGYTPQAEYQGKSYFNKPQKITSFAEFQAFYLKDNPPPPADPAKQYEPQYYLVAQDHAPSTGDYMIINGKYFSILPDPSTIYYLYNSIRLFYQNGGGDAYIVSVGTYGAPSGEPLAAPEDRVVNSNVELSALQNGLALLKNEEEPTMYIMPEATLLSVDNNETLMHDMLLQSEEMGTTVCIFDIIGGKDPDPIMYTNDIETFRDSVGVEGLKYGVAYYPFVGTTIMQSADIDYTNLFGGDVEQLSALLSPPNDPNPSVDKILSMIETPPANPLTVSQYDAALIDASPMYSVIMNHVLSDANILPPSGGMAGVYTVNDNNFGVWHAPSNTSMVGVADLPIRLNSTQAEALAIDTVSGISINVIRFFDGQGVLVSGAYTLDGNSQDWSNVSVRRTMTFLEQSVKLAARPYVFEPNDENTWGAVKAMISSFLTSIWKEGGLQGASADDAFQVEVGLGTTMTAEDLLNGFMRVTVKVAIEHPAEFMVITFEQQMANSE